MPSRAKELTDFVSNLHSLRAAGFNQRFSGHMNRQGGPSNRPQGKALGKKSDWQQIQRQQGGGSATGVVEQVKISERKRAQRKKRTKKDTEEKIAEVNRVLNQIEDQKARLRAAGIEPASNRTEDRGGGGWFDNGIGGFVGKAVGSGLNVVAKPLDIIARPGYATAEAVKEFVTSTGEEGKSPIDALQDTAGGLWSGLSGREKTGWGDVIQAQREHGTGWSTSILGGLTSLAADEKIGPKGFNIPGPGWRVDIEDVVGLGGDIASDPTTYIGGFVAKPGTAAIKAGVRRGIKEANTEIAEKLARTGLTNKGLRAVVGDADKEAQNLIDEILTGSMAGTTTYSRLVPETVANRAATQMRNRLLGQLDIWKRNPRGAMPAIAEARDRGMANAMGQIGSQGLNPKAMIAVIQKGGDDAAIKYADDAAQTVQRHVRQAVEEAAKADRRFALRVGVLPGKRSTDILERSRISRQLYKPIAHMADSAKSKRLIQSMADSFSYKEHFPGITASLRQAVLSKGVREYEHFRDGLLKTFKDAGVTRAQRIEIQKALAGGYRVVGNTANGTPLADLQDVIRKAYNDLHAEEIKLGVRNVTDAKDPNYVFQFYKRGALNTRRDFKEGLKKDIRANGTATTHTLDDAARAGLHPEMDALKSLFLRKANSQRKIVRRWFDDELLNSFGEKAPLGINAGAHNLELVPKASPAMTSKLGKGETWYLPKEIKKVKDSFDQLMKIGNPDYLNKFLRYFDNINRQFKFWTTAIWPSFHVRNMLGDSVLSFLDGVTPADYTRVTRAWVNKQAGKKSVVKISGREIPLDKLIDDYMSTARASQYYHAEATNEAFDAWGRVSEGLRKGSEIREDFVRFIHYVSALDAEMKLQSKRLSWGKAYDKAKNVARLRVNKFNIDYNALTPLERQVFKRLMPFYTFTRHAAPLILQNVFMNPGRLNLINKGAKAVEQLLGVDPNETFSEFMVPQWQRDVGYVQLENGEEPNIWSMNALPSSVPGQIFGGGNREEFVQNFTGMLNPLISAVPELATGEDLFSGSSIQPSLTEYALSQFRPTAEYGRIRRTGFNPFKFLGIDVSKVTERQQLSELRRQQDPVEAQLSDLNSRMRDVGIKIQTVRKKEGRRYQVRSTTGNAVFGEFETPAEAQTAANRLVGG